MVNLTPHTEMMNDLLRLAVESGVSDIIIKANKPGYVRLAGRLKPVDMEPITSPEAQAFVDEHVPKVFRKQWEDDGQVDFAYSFEGVGRFRVNAFHQRGLVSIVMRHIKSVVPNFEQLGLGTTADALIKMAQAKDGICWCAG
jgi:twitching motility protein PilT